MTRLTRLLNSELPIVLGPFGGASSVELVGTVADLGGVGSYGLYGYDAERIADTAAQLRARTTGRIALNLWLPRGDEVTPGDVDATPGPGVGQLLEEMDAQPVLPERFLPPIEEQVDAAIEARPAVLSFVYGVPSADLIERAHAAGIAVVATATTVPEALALEVTDIDGARGVIRVRHGKGDVAREVKLSPTLYTWLREYWKEERPPLPYLFASPRTGRPPLQETVWHAFRLASEQAGLKKCVKPHMLRHSCGTHLLAR